MVTGPGDAASFTVEQTAVGVAAIRALETERADRLFSDPFAGALVAAAGRTLADYREAAALDRRTPEYWSAIQRWVVARTRFLDDFLTSACTRDCRQVVILAAGLDTRGYRLDVPTGTRWFEVDLPGVLDFKADVLRSAEADPRGEYRAVTCDLRADWPAALTAVGFRAEPTAWIVEGLLVYLTDDENERLMGQISELSPPGSELGLTIRGKREPSGISMAPDALRALQQSAGIADPVAWLARHGWSATATRGSDPSVTHGRADLAGPADPGRSSGRLVAATRNGI